MQTKFKGFIFLFGAIAAASLACQSLTGQTPDDTPPATAEILPATDVPQPTVAVNVPQESSSASCAPFDGIPTQTQYTSAPEMSINTDGKYLAAMRLAKGGDILIELYAKDAPITVNSFIFLACKGFYDGSTFHRVLQDFMAQGGDPTGTGRGGSGYEFVNEYSDLSFDKPGVVAMANAGPDTNGSQFFITFGPAEWLDGGYTIFGQVIEGMDVVMSITLRDPDFSPPFTGDVIESVTISGQ